MFRLSDFDDPDGKYTAASYTSTSSRNDGYITLMTIPFAGTLYLEESLLPGAALTGLSLVLWRLWKP